jgi:hypothetical protein
VPFCRPFEAMILGVPVASDITDYSH